jgi:Leucine-rich repeat (LRR) protein/uncharacterized Zn finger protein (UPF0148 family)
METRTVDTLIDDIEELIRNTKFSENITNQLNKKLAEFKNDGRLYCPISEECFSDAKPAYTILTGQEIQTVISLQTKTTFEDKEVIRDPYNRFKVLGYQFNQEIMDLVKETEKKLEYMEKLIREEIEHPSELEEFTIQFTLLEKKEKEKKALLQSSIFFESKESNLDLTKYLTKNKLDLSNQDILNVEIFKCIVPFLRNHPEITILNLRGGRIRAAGARALAQISTLISLDLSNNRLGDEGAEAFVKNTTLKLLDISKNSITDLGIEALAKNKALTTLIVSTNKIGRKGIEALAKNTMLKSLTLSRCGLGSKEIEPLAKNTSLTSLDVSRNDLGDAGAKIIAANKTLVMLDVSCNEIGPTGAKAFSTNTTLKSLTISLNAIQTEGVKSLAKNTTLKLLDLSKMNLAGSEAAGALANNTTLMILDMSQTLMNADGAAALSKNKTLKTLDVSYNDIGAAGAIFLSRNTTLQELYVCGSFLYETNIGVDGALALAKNTTLTMLDLDGNNIKFDDDKVSIFVSLEHANVQDRQKRVSYKEIKGTSEQLDRLRKAVRFRIEEDPDSFYVMPKEIAEMIGIDNTDPDITREVVIRKPCSP